MSSPKACGAAPTTLASGLGAPHGIVVDASYVYWVNNTAGTIMKCALGGCGGIPTIIATGLNGPFGLAQDATALYFTEYVNGGLVLKLAK
jgi:hypothetical protein